MYVPAITENDDFQERSLPRSRHDGTLPRSSSRLLSLFSLFAERATYSKSSKRENDLLKIQQERE